MYIRYISRLSELHYTANNFVEAGLTLRLYAQLLSWSDHKLPAEMSYPSETEAERKEELVKRIMDCFDKGKVSCLFFKFIWFYYINYSEIWQFI